MPAICRPRRRSPLSPPTAAALTAALLTVLMALPAVAATLETHAVVRLVEPTDAMVVATADAGPAWTLDGPADDRLQVSIELRDADGNVLEWVSGDEVTLDDVGRASAALPRPETADPHAPLPITTVVIVRE
jgi:hypothetical protein